MRAAVVASVLLFASTATAMPVEPIVFDFEDGLQGWELSGSAQRVQTQVLGGEWAIFGDGFIDGTSLAPPLTGDRGFDLSQFRSITMDVFVVDGDPEGLTAVISIARTLLLAFTAGFDVADPMQNPGLRELDLQQGLKPLPPGDLLGITWGLIPCDPSNPFCTPRDMRNVAFIDNITFHPIPEPGSVALLLLGLVGMAAVSRKGRMQEIPRKHS